MSSDELKVPSQRSEDVDERSPGSQSSQSSHGSQGSQGDEPGRFARDDEPGERAYDDAAGERSRGDLNDEEEFARSEQTTAPSPTPAAAGERADDDDGDDEEREERRAAESPRADDEYVAAVPGAVVAPVPGAVPAPVPVPAPGDEDAAYRDPYARTGGDMLADPDPDSEPGTESVSGPGPDPVHTSASAEVPAHAAPDDVTLFDQDPAQVQARWRDLQAGFVDDPGEAVQRADGLVGEVVDSLTSSLTTRTNALRERWKDVGTPDTEQLRLALRDYRNVLERLLALSSHQSSQTSGHQSEETR
jgi:hypothetical protein